MQKLSKLTIMKSYCLFTCDDIISALLHLQPDYRMIKPLSDVRMLLARVIGPGYHFSFDD